MRHFRLLMIAAYRLGMTGGDYLFLMCTRYNGDFFGNYSWYRGDEYDEVTSCKSRDIIFLSDIQFTLIVQNIVEPLWSWSYGSWILHYLCNQCLSLLQLSIRIPLIARCTWYNIMWLAADRRFSPATPVSFTNKTARHDITEKLLKISLNAKTLFWTIFYQDGLLLPFEIQLFQIQLLL